MELTWHCGASNFSGTYEMARVAGGRPLWEADVSAGLECPSNGTEAIVTLQVNV